MWRTRGDPSGRRGRRFAGGRGGGEGTGRRRGVVERDGESGRRGYLDSKGSGEETRPPLNCQLKYAGIIRTTKRSAVQSTGIRG